MKQVKIKIETTVEATLGDKPVNDLLKDIADLCHKTLKYSTSKEKGCEMLYEDQEYEDYRNDGRSSNNSWRCDLSDIGFVGELKLENGIEDALNYL